MNKDSNILLTGGHGFLGNKVYEELAQQGYTRVMRPSHGTLDLCAAEQVYSWFRENGTDIVINCAAHCGGIGLNQARPGELFYDNMLMGMNLIQAARQWEVEKFVQLGTVCEYPKHAPTPFKEDSLWDGYPEETNAPYGVAKRALLVMGNAYRQQYGLNIIHLLPVNLYGPGDNFKDDSSHVVAALIKKFFIAKMNNLPEVTVWGDGTAYREFLYVEDAARGIVLATDKYNSAEPVNLGTGVTTSIRELVTMIAGKIGYEGHIGFDRTKPNGQPERRLDITKAMDFGFVARVDLAEGLDKTISWYIDWYKRFMMRPNAKLKEHIDRMTDRRALCPCSNCRTTPIEP